MGVRELKATGALRGPEAGAEPPRGAPVPDRRGRGRLSPAELYPAGDHRLATRFLRLPSGERVRVVSAGRPSGPPVVLVHGWACSLYSWRHQLAALAEAGFHASALDLRGHGLSDKPELDEAYTADAMADFLVKALDALGLERTALVGHSLGASIAARVAVAQPERVARLAVISGVGFGRTRLVGALGRIPDRLVSPLLPLVAPRALFRVVLRLVSGGPGRYGARDVDEYWAPTQFPEFVPALWRLVRMHGWALLEEPERSRLTMPVLALFGGRDRLVAARVPGAAGPDAGHVGAAGEVHLLAGVGHAGHEEAPELVNALLLPFLLPWRG